MTNKSIKQETDKSALVDKHSPYCYLFTWKSITALVSGISKYKVELRWLLWNHENMIETGGEGVVRAKEC